MKKLKKLLGIILIGMALVGNALATDGTWTNVSGGAWSNVNNWSGGIVASGLSSTAYFTNYTGVTITNTYLSLTNCNFFFSNANYVITGGTNSLGGGNGISTFTLASSSTSTISTVLSGTNALRKIGSGILILSATNTYTGNTIVSNGTLQINNANALPSTTTLYLSTDTTNNLNFTGIDTITALYLNGVLQPNGTYGTNGVTYINTTYFTGNGILQVGIIPSSLRTLQIPYYQNQLFYQNQLTPQ